jgi:hypothetical protein
MLTPTLPTAMSLLKKILIVVPPAVITFLTGRIIWPPAVDMAPPTSQQLPFFIGMAAIEAIGFGIGVLFLVTTWSRFRSVSQEIRGLATAAYVSIAWMLLSWWPHDNMHIHNGHDIQGLIYIEYGFHATLIIAAIIVAIFFVKTLRPSIGPSPIQAKGLPSS